MQIRVFPVSTENFLNAKPHFLLWSRNCRFHLLIIAVFSSTLREQRSILQLNIYFHFPAYGGLNHSNIHYHYSYTQEDEHGTTYMVEPLAYQGTSCNLLVSAVSCNTSMGNQRHSQNPPVVGLQ